MDLSKYQPRSVLYPRAPIENANRWVPPKVAPTVDTRGKSNDIFKNSNILIIHWSSCQIQVSADRYRVMLVVLSEELRPLPTLLHGKKIYFHLKYKTLN